MVIKYSRLCIFIIIIMLFTIYVCNKYRIIYASVSHEISTIKPQKKDVYIWKLNNKTRIIYSNSLKMVIFIQTWDKIDEQFIFIYTDENYCENMNESSAILLKDLRIRNVHNQKYTCVPNFNNFLKLTFPEQKMSIRLPDTIFEDDLKIINYLGKRGIFHFK
jgi:hypothetical protein